MKHYDYLVVGAGLFGATFAYEAKKRGKEVLVIDKRDHIAGNIYTKEVDGINVHVYGAHIFHTRTRLSGNTSISLQNLTIISTLRSQFTRTNFITCHST